MTWPLVSMMTEPSLNATDLRCFCSTYMDQGSGLVTPGGGTKRKLEKNVTSGNKKKIKGNKYAALLYPTV